MRNPNVQNTKSSVLLLALTKHPNGNKIQMMQPDFFFTESITEIYKNPN